MTGLKWAALLTTLAVACILWGYDGAVREIRKDCLELGHTRLLKEYFQCKRVQVD